MPGAGVELQKLHFYHGDAREMSRMKEREREISKIIYFYKIKYYDGILLLIRLGAYSVEAQQKIKVIFSWEIFPRNIYGDKNYSIFFSNFW